MGRGNWWSWMSQEGEFHSAQIDYRDCRMARTQFIQTDGRKFWSRMHNENMLIFYCKWCVKSRGTSYTAPRGGDRVANANRSQINHLRLSSASKVVLRGDRKCKEGARELASWPASCDYEGSPVLDRLNVGSRDHHEWLTGYMLATAESSVSAHGRLLPWLQQPCFHSSPLSRTFLLRCAWILISTYRSE